MVATRSARERKAAAQAGPLATVQVDAPRTDPQTGAAEELVYRIGCTACTSKTPAKSTRDGRRWSTYRPGDDNGFMAAMDRWVFHLREQHADVDEAAAPCLAYLAEAQQRLHERRQR